MKGIGTFLINMVKAPYLLFILLLVSVMVLLHVHGQLQDLQQKVNGPQPLPHTASLHITTGSGQVALLCDKGGEEGQYRIGISAPNHTGAEYHCDIIKPELFN